MEIKKILFILVVFSSISLVCAQNIGIEVGNNYIPGETIQFKITLYDENSQKINGQIDYMIKNYYSEIISEGVAESGREITFKLPENSVQGHWAVVVGYNGKEQKQLFNVGDLEKAEIKLEGDNLVVSNIGNIPYTKRISISIGNHYETALIPLEVGQIKKIRLTAPPGEYDVKVSDGTKENTFEVQGVILTGDVIGLESVLQDGFWNKYPLVGLFLGALLLVIVIVFGLKLMKRFSK